MHKRVYPMRSIIYCSVLGLIVIAIAAAQSFGTRKEPFACLESGVTHADDTLCQIQADAGYVCPLVVKSPTYIIEPYQNQSPRIQALVVEQLRNYWGIIYTPEYVRRTWVDTDVLYVATTNEPHPKLIGCMAVDRKHFYPFISHLLVVEEFRKQGHGARLIQLGEDYARSLGFTEVKMWCEPDSRAYYEKKGWKVEDFIEKKYVLTKAI